MSILHKYSFVYMYVVILYLGKLSFFSLKKIIESIYIFYLYFHIPEKHRHQKLHIKNVYTSGCELEDFSSPSGHLAMSVSGDIFVVTIGVVTGIQGVEGKDAVKHSTLCRTPPPSTHTSPQRIMQPKCK